MAVLKKGMGTANINFFWWDSQILFYKHENSFVKVCTKQTLIFFFFFNSIVL